MIADSQNKALLILADSAKENPAWQEYANYCLNREKGLRKIAFKHLNNFISNTSDWTLNERIDFICSIFTLFETIEDADYGGFPQPLSEKLIKPTLLEWCKLEDKDNRPFRWYGRYYHDENYLQRALEINPNDDNARIALISIWCFHTYYSVHHLPEGYMGDPIKDLALTRKIKDQIELLINNKAKENWHIAINEDIELIENYIEWKESGHPDFDKWGEENQKSTGYESTRLYYYEK